jgi:phosphatidylglycerol---prolipoprotein diacylglyceryl transferase
MPTHPRSLPLSFIPSPPINGFHLGPLDIHFYGLMYVVAIALAIYITRRRWRALGGNPDLVWDVAIWVVPAGIIGGRIYFDLTTPADIPHVWYGVLAVWSGGLGIWGGIAAGALVGVWRVRRAGASAGLFANAIAPALLVAQAAGRVGNYFNQELFGKPSGLPWALKIDMSARLTQQIPAADLKYSTFQPSFLYEMIFDLALAAFLVWLGHHRRIRPWGLFALYVAGYSGYRIFEETIRIDSSQYFLGLRLNFFVAITLAVVGLAWFALTLRTPELPAGTGVGRPAGGGSAGAGVAAAAEGEESQATEPEPGGATATAGSAQSADDGQRAVAGSAERDSLPAGAGGDPGRRGQDTGGRNDR